jgi:hypothetical protein
MGLAEKPVTNLVRILSGMQVVALQEAKERRARRAMHRAPKHGWTLASSKLVVSNMRTLDKALLERAQA